MKNTLRDRHDCPTPTRRLPCLVVDDGKEKGRIISIGRASLTLGRDRNSGIRIEARGVSRRHARFHIRKGAVKVEDLGSTNGTWRNGRRVKQALLKDGDQLQFGACLATFRQDHMTAPSKRGGGVPGVIKVNIVRIGGACLIQIPKALLDQCGLEGELEMIPDGNRLILRQSAYGIGKWQQ